MKGHRILVVSPYPPPPDGIGAHSRLLAQAWRRSGHEVHVACRRGEPGADADSGIIVHRVLAPGADARSVADTVDPDIVVVQFAIPSLTTVWPMALRVVERARARGARVVTAFHEPVRERDLLGPVARGVYAVVRRHTDVCVTFSSGGARVLADLGIASAHVLPLGVPPTPRIDDAQRRHVSDKYGLTTDTLVALGFIHPDKGTDDLIKAGELLRRRGVRIDLLVAGTVRPRRGPFRLMELADRRFDRRLHRLAAGSPSTRFAGFVPEADLLPILAGVGALVLPYRRTTQSGVGGLALAVATPVVASELDGLRDTFAEAACYVPVGDPVALAAGLDEVRRPDVQARLRSAAAARRAEIGIEQVAARLLELARST